jgi:hypothetical protein
MNFFSRHATTSPLTRFHNRPLRLERLEERLAMANIVWVNEFDASNTFDTAERNLINAAIGTWENIILDFDSDPNNAPRDFNVTIIHQEAWRSSGGRRVRGAFPG